MRRAKAFHSHGQGFKNFAFFVLILKLRVLTSTSAAQNAMIKKLFVASVLAQVSVFCDAIPRIAHFILRANKLFARGHVELLLSAQKKKHVLQITIRHFIFYSLINGCVINELEFYEGFELKKKIIMSLLRAECRAI